MPKPPSISPRRFIRILGKIGFSVIHSKGSHIVFAHPDGRKTIVPMHSKDIPPGTMRGIIGDLKMTVEDFKKLMRSL